MTEKDIISGIYSHLIKKKYKNLEVRLTECRREIICTYYIEYNLNTNKSISIFVSVSEHEEIFCNTYNQFDFSKHSIKLHDPNLLEKLTRYLRSVKP